MIEVPVYPDEPDTNGEDAHAGYDTEQQEQQDPLRCAHLYIKLV